MQQMRKPRTGRLVLLSSSLGEGCCTTRRWWCCPSPMARAGHACQRQQPLIGVLPAARIISMFCCWLLLLLGAVLPTTLVRATCPTGVTPTGSAGIGGTRNYDCSTTTGTSTSTPSVQRTTDSNNNNNNPHKKKPTTVTNRKLHHHPVRVQSAIRRILLVVKHHPPGRGGGGGRGKVSQLRGGESSKILSPTTLITPKKQQQQKQRQQVEQSIPNKKLTTSTNKKTEASSSSSIATTTPPATMMSQTPTQKKDDARVRFLIRLLFLSYYGSLGSIMPYLPVYYDSLGHGGQIIGMLGAVKPATTFMVAPIWGLIADETQNPFLILKITFFVSLLGQLLMSIRHDAPFIMSMVFLTALFNAPVKSLIDSMVLDSLYDKSTYGRLRLWGQMGFGLCSSTVGLLLSKSKPINTWPESTTFSPMMNESLLKLPTSVRLGIETMNKVWQSMTGYKLLFLSYATLSIPAWFCIYEFRQLQLFQKAKAAAAATAVSTTSKTKASKQITDKTTKKIDKDEHSRIIQGLSILIQNADALLFFFLVFIVGLSSGMIENFAYVRMREVGGTGKEMGLSRLVSSLAGAPMFWFSGSMSAALGADRVIALALCSYVTRFLIYALMKNPYQGLPAEALRGVTFAAFWSTCTIYAHRVSPPGLHATMLMFMNAMYGGLGQSLGAIIGGRLQHRYGTVQTFLYASAVDLSFVIILVAYLSVRKNSNFRNPQPYEAKKKLVTNQ